MTSEDGREPGADSAAAADMSEATEAPAVKQEQGAPAEEVASPSPPIAIEGEGDTPPKKESTPSTGASEGKGGGESKAEEQPPKKKSRYHDALKKMSTEQHASDVRSDKKIGFYKMKQTIGKGAFGLVKMGVHTLTSVKVAVKMVDKGRLSVRETKTLIREIHLLDMMHHPNILQLFEVKETAGKMYIIMEYASGGELYGKVRDSEGGRFSEGQARHVFGEVVAGIEHVHSKGVTHRDIKAENILFDKDGHAKLCDFGLGRQFEEDYLTTYCGSPHYCAPEIFKQNPYYGPFYDIWSLGILLFYMVVGRMPFAAESVSKIKARVLALDYKIPDFVSDECREVLLGIMKEDPEERWSIDKIRQSAFMEGVEFPDETDKFLTPGTVRKSTFQFLEGGEASQMMKEAQENDTVDPEVMLRLREIGISINTLATSAEEKSTRSSVVGMYRLLTHKVSREKGLKAGADSQDSVGSHLGPGNLEIVQRKESTRSIATGVSMKSTPGSKGGSPQANAESKMCTLL